MTFQPVVPLSGYSGWRFLQRTLEPQQAAFRESPVVGRATTHFRDRIATIRTADDLVNDRQLLSVALGAFGLDEDINSKFFIRKILDDGTLTNDALANRLSDKRYAAFSRAFGFGDFAVGNTGQPGFADRILARYEARQFERAVGEQNNDLRLALNLSTAIDDITAQTGRQNAQWFAVMGNQPLRQVFEMALGLPSALARIDLDQQLDVFKDRAKSVFGTDSVASFAAPEAQEKLIRLFLIRSEANAASTFSGGSAALTLLQSSTNSRRSTF